MGALVLREPDARERKWILGQWLGDVLPKSARATGAGIPKDAQRSGLRGPAGWERGEGYWRSPDPVVLLHPRLYREAMREYVKRAFQRASVLVAELAVVPGEAVGWVVFETSTDLALLNIDEPDGVTHYVRVLGPARRHGIGTQLLQAAGTAAPAYLTPAGAGLIASMDARPGAAHTRSSDGPRDRSEAMAVVERR